MAGTRSATGGLDNSIVALLTQLSEGNRHVEARLIPQVFGSIDVMALPQTLEHLTTSHSLQRDTVEFHFFVHLPFEAIALILQISERNVKCDGSMAGAWLKGELSSQP